MKKCIFLSVFILLNMILLLIFSEDRGNIVVNASEVEKTSIKKPNFRDLDSVEPYETPTPIPGSVLGALLSAGYRKQPTKETYAKMGSTVTLYTDSDRSALSSWSNWFARPKYQWYYRPYYDKNWIPISKEDGGTNKNLKIKEEVKRTRYYQQQVTWNTFPSTVIYSNLAMVSFTDFEVPATGIKTEVDDSYLYNMKDNNSSVYAHAQLIPFNSTNRITWSSSNDNLAKIDPDTGLITANNVGNSGKLLITATANDEEGNSNNNITSSFEIEVGGGLDSQTIKSGKTATFKIRGNIDQQQTSINWYKVQNSTPVKVAESGISYTTPPAKLPDDGTQYFAEIKINERTNSQKLTTSHATLTVESSGSPKIVMNDSIGNLTYEDNSFDKSDTFLSNVVSGDVISIKSQLFNESSESSLNDASFILPLYKNMSIQKIWVDDKLIDSTQYSVKNNILEISKINFLGIDYHSIEISLTMGPTAKEEFVSTPFIKGTDSDGLFYQQAGLPLTLNLFDNLLKLTAHNIEFGTHHFVQEGQSVDRINHNNVDDPVVEVDDQRRNKKEVTIKLSQDDYFRNTKDQNIILPVSLKYYYSDGNYTDLSKNNVYLTFGNEGESAHSLSWYKNEGLKLYFNSSDVKPGSYTTKLTWTEVASV
ncbi:Ig-like domain-containing protein [Companilactobacillus baiquanensis]|uniref:Ig-like domain-containing protein n=1 Tax=Companilactobacillus baiquanensis TaxID=2486005 RepID=A0ABW1UV09_9LACO|nr:Ig-like domain-containing protein [Companilactobacillus baiquanensis]